MSHPATSTDYTIDVRVSNDAVAFRFVVPGTGARVPDAGVTFTIPAGAAVWSHGLRDHYEALYEKKSIEIIPEANRLLPDPRLGWVDMTYRIKAGRTDNEYGPREMGELDIWANGLKIVSVRGNIGYTLRLENPVELIGPYFKFGLYRARTPGSFDFHFDEFSQARARAGLAALCP